MEKRIFIIVCSIFGCLTAIIIGMMMYDIMDGFYKKHFSSEYPNIQKDNLFTTIHLEWNIKAICLNDNSVCTCFKKQSYQWTETSCPNIITEYQNAK